MAAKGTDAPQDRLTRLKQRREFLRVAAARHSAARPGLVLQAARRPVPAPGKSIGGGASGCSGAVRYGLTVSRKVGNAVIRNRARRRLRAAAEQMLAIHGVAGVDYVLIGRRDSVRRPFASLIDDLTGAMRKLDCWQDGTRRDA